VIFYKNIDSWLTFKNMVYTRRNIDIIWQKATLGNFDCVLALEECIINILVR